MRRDLYYKKEVRREFENFGNLWSKGTAQRLRFCNLQKQQIPAKYRWALSHMK